jgi:hypothetical protein
MQTTAYVFGISEISITGWHSMLMASMMQTNMRLAA